MIKQELTDAWHIALLKKDAMHKVAGEKAKTAYGYYILISAAVLSVVGQQLFPFLFKPTLIYALLMGAMQIIMAVIGIYLMSFVAKSVFKGTAGHDEFFRVLAYGMIVTWMNFIPQLGIISGVWGLILLFVVLRTVHKLTAGGAIGTIVISIVLLMVAGLILSPVYRLAGVPGAGGMMPGKWTMPGRMDNFLSGKEFNIKTEEGDANVKFQDGAVKFTNEKGETVEWTIPVKE